MWILVNIGCIECGVSSNIVGVFTDKAMAEDLAGILDKSNSWREDGQNHYEVFEMPVVNVIADEYLDFVERSQPGAAQDRRE